MGKIKKYLITIVVMLVVSVLALIILGLLTYWFKWQADKAMVGIVVTYVMAGIAGGVMTKICSRMQPYGCAAKENIVQIMEVFLVAISYILALSVASILLFKTSPIMSFQLFMIFGLVFFSVFIGKLLTK